MNHSSGVLDISAARVDETYRMKAVKVGTNFSLSNFIEIWCAEGITTILRKKTHAFLVEANVIRQDLREYHIKSGSLRVPFLMSLSLP